MDTDVLVVGAGPTGLMLAAQLARRGVRPFVIDRHAGPARETRALGVQARTLEIYRHLGIDADAVALGRKASGAHLWSGGKPRAHIPLGDIGRTISPHPYLLILGQDDNERLLGEVLRRLGIDVHWKTELVGFEQHADRVAATLLLPDGSRRVLDAAWVAGCDGAKSAVRDMNDIPFEGAPYEHVFFVADVEVTGPMVPDTLNVYLWRNGFHLFFPMRGENHWRVAGILPEAIRARPGLVFDDVEPSLRAEVGVALQFRACRWFSTYRIHHRRAARFRDGRCFVLGDAAHIHSPVGAQGMNTGLQDAYNLAWKLALVVRGQARDALLDSYHSERLPVANRLLATTDRAFSLVVSDNFFAGVYRTLMAARVVNAGMRFERFRRLVFRTISQTGIRYPDSPVSQNLGVPPDAAPRAGDRFPWVTLEFADGAGAEDIHRRFDDTTFNLVVVGQPAPAGNPALAGGMLKVHAVGDGAANRDELARAGIPAQAFYLVRPDGYVGLAGTRLDPAALEAYARERLHLGANTP